MLSHLRRCNQIMNVLTFFHRVQLTSTKQRIQEGHTKVRTKHQACQDATTAVPSTVGIEIDNTSYQHTQVRLIVCVPVMTGKIVDWHYQHYCIVTRCHSISALGEIRSFVTHLIF